MGARLFYLLVIVFFVTMNVLLWRTDITGRTEFDSRLAPKLVWEKALTAAGESCLEIRYKGAKVGTARWQPNISEASSSKYSPDVAPPEGMIEAVSSYQVELDGNFALDEFTRFRFGLHLKLGTNYAWQELGLRLNFRPYAMEVQAVAAEQKVRIKTEGEDGIKERRFAFSELQNPDKLLDEIGQPWLPGALLALGLPLNQRSGKTPFQINWQARNDSITVQHAHIRGYRLQTKLLDRYPISIFLNSAGEILRIDLPGDLVLLSDSLTNL